MNFEAQRLNQTEVSDVPVPAPEVSATFVGEGGKILEKAPLSDQQGNALEQQGIPPEQLIKIQKEAHRLTIMSAHYVKLGMIERAVQTLFELSNYYRNVGMRKEAQAVLNQADTIDQTHGKTTEQRSENVHNLMDNYLSK